MKQYKHATIIPLIGGMPIAQQMSFNNQPPEYVLSYSAFNANDSHYLHWLNNIRKYDVPYVVLDSQEQQPTISESCRKVDAICATPPCAGLSSFSTTSGADSAVNDWMYISTQQVLEEYRPRVFWGENAPRLFTEKGKPVVDRLKEIGEKNGYSMMLYGTQSRLHGNPQIRPRTFFFFFEGNTVPIFPFFRKDQEGVESILSTPVDDADPMNISISKGNPDDEAWARAAKHFSNTETLAEIYDKLPKSYNLLIYAIEKSESFDRLSEYFMSIGEERAASRVMRMKAKVNDNKGFWSHGLTIAKQEIPSLIGAQPSSLISINQETKESRFLTLRDALRLMKMPEDFILAHTNPLACSNHICQNVIITTAKDMSDSIIQFFNNELPTVHAKEVRINNNNKTILVDGKPYQANSTSFKLI
jgi:site-specific DNA-cytosine methylase